MFLVSVLDDKAGQLRFQSEKYKKRCKIFKFKNSLREICSCWDPPIYISYLRPLLVVVNHVRN